MQISQKNLHDNNFMPMTEPDSHLIRQNCKSPNRLYSDDDGSQIRQTTSQTSQLQYCTLESLSNTSWCYTSYNSPSTVSITPTSGSPLSNQDHQSDNTYGSPVSVSCITDDPNTLQLKLRELENAILGPDPDNLADSIESSFESNLLLDPERVIQMMGIDRSDLKQMLLALAQSVSENQLTVAEWLITKLRQMVSVSGEPLQRIGAYLLEGIVARLSSSGSSIYKALKCKEPTSNDLLSYMHLLYEACPYFKFGYVSANGAIAEAFRDEDNVHIIDFQIAQGTQWVTLLQALAKRPGGPPHVRVTGIDDAQSAHARGGGLHIVGKRLSQFAKSLGVELEFHAVVLPVCEIKASHFYVNPKEALAVNFPFMLHHVPDESVSLENHRDRILRMVKSLSPKVVTLVEQESNTNTAPFFPRFAETLDYYNAIFESIDVTLPRDSRERINVEQHCLARDIVNIIACEGAERVERHEPLGKWRSRFTMAGFTPVPLSSHVNATLKSLLENYNNMFRLEERDGALYLGWKNRALSVSCAWR